MDGLKPFCITLFVLAGAVAGAQEQRAASSKRLIFNQDNSEFFIGSFGPVRPETVDSYIKSIAGKAVTDLFICVNAQRTNYRSKVWEADWDGYDPKGGDDQPFFAGIAPDRAFEREWTRMSYEWSRFGVDYPARALAAARVNGMRGWLSVRMNDAHYPARPGHPYHSTFWRQHPEWHLEGTSLDYGRKEVREHYLALIRELLSKYEMQGLELDFMRHGHYFRPEKIHEGRRIMTAFVAEVRKLATDAAKRSGRRLQIAVRVPGTPWIAAQRGLDAVAWAKQGDVDLIAASPWWASTQSDIPVETWKGALIGTRAEVAVALEDGISSGPVKRRAMLPEESRGVALAAVHRGADAIYLFNLFTGPIQKWSPDEYSGFLTTAANEEKLRALPRRHPVTIIDPWAEGEPGTPAPLAQQDSVVSFRIAIGPAPRAGDEVTAGLGFETGATIASVQLNGIEGAEAGRDGDLTRYKFPATAARAGHNLVRVTRSGGPKLTWVELRVVPRTPSFR